MAEQLPFLLRLQLPARKTAKKKKTNQPKASTTRGFGAKPLTFAQVVEQFPTQVPPNADSLPCPCQVDTRQSSNGANNNNNQQETLDLLPRYADCCAPYHQRDHERRRLPESPERVLRSRYSAFCYRLIDHVIQTTHPEADNYTNDHIQWAKNLNTKNGMFDDYNFVNLEVLGDTLYSNLQQDEATLEFLIRFRPKDGAGPLEESFWCENGRFLKDDDHGWLYVDSEISPVIKKKRRQKNSRKLWILIHDNYL